MADVDADRYRILGSISRERVKPTPDRPTRNRGWINLGPPLYDGRAVWSLHTGMYEHGLQHGQQPHGKFAFDCTVLANLPLGLRDAAVPILSFFGLVFACALSSAIGTLLMGAIQPGSTPPATF